MSELRPRHPDPALPWDKTGFVSIYVYSAMAMYLLLLIFRHPGWDRATSRLLDLLLLLDQVMSVSARRLVELIR